MAQPFRAGAPSWICELWQMPGSNSASSMRIRLGHSKFIPAKTSSAPQPRLRGQAHPPRLRLFSFPVDSPVGFSKSVLVPAPKPVRKRFLPKKGVAFLWEGVFAKKFSGADFRTFRPLSHSSRWAKAQNRCAIARCAGSPTASAVIGGEIVNSGRGALS